MVTAPSNLSEGVKNTQINFQCHTESISQHEDYFKAKTNYGNNAGKDYLFSIKGGIIILEPIPYSFKSQKCKNKPSFCSSSCVEIHATTKSQNTLKLTKNILETALKLL